jgi:hypothetical protein
MIIQMEGLPIRTEDGIKMILIGGMTIIMAVGTTTIMVVEGPQGMAQDMEDLVAMDQDIGDMMIVDIMTIGQVILMAVTEIHMDGGPKAAKANRIKASVILMHHTGITDGGRIIQMYLIYLLTIMIFLL